MEESNMNQENLLHASPPPLHTVFCDALPAAQITQNIIDKNTIEEFLSLSKVYLGLDKKA